MTEITAAFLYGQDAVDYARENGCRLSAHADPIEPARHGMKWDSDAVIERMRVDPGLVYVDVVKINIVLGVEPQQIEATIEFRDAPPTCPMCAADDVPISDDELAAAEAAGTICDQCAEVVAENRAALGCS